MARKKLASGGLVLIAQAAHQAGIHPQTIRVYEQAGLLTPLRSQGGTRVYGAVEIDRIRLIVTLTGQLGLNLAGVQRVLELEAQLERSRQELDRQSRRSLRREAVLLERSRDLEKALGAALEIIGVLQLESGPRAQPTAGLQ